MTINEKAAYIKGLAEGLNLDDSKPEVKVINELLALVSDMADELNEVECEVDDVSDVVVELQDEVSELESDFDEFAEAVANVMEDFAYGDDEYDDDEDELFDEDNPDYEVKCPDCGAEIVVDEDTLLEGEINCPNCGNELEFDFTSLFADEVCDCGDPDCPMCNPE